MHLHILNEELNLRQIIMRRKQPGASHGLLEAQHFYYVLLAVTDQLKEFLGAHVVGFDGSKFEVVVDAVLDVFGHLHTLQHLPHNLTILLNLIILVSFINVI